MTHAYSARSPLRRIMSLFMTAALMLSLSVTLSLTTAGNASAICAASGFEGRWRSSSDRLSRIDVWAGQDCSLHAQAWSTCKYDSTRDCAWGTRRLESTPVRNFRFITYTWSNADEVLQLTLQDWSNLKVYRHKHYHSGEKYAFTVWMVKDR